MKNLYMLLAFMVICSSAYRFRTMMTLNQCDAGMVEDDSGNCVAVTLDSGDNTLPECGEGEVLEGTVCVVDQSGDNNDCPAGQSPDDNGVCSCGEGMEPDQNDLSMCVALGSGKNDCPEGQKPDDNGVCSCGEGMEPDQNDLSMCVALGSGKHEEGKDQPSEEQVAKKMVEAIEDLQKMGVEWAQLTPTVEPSWNEDADKMCGRQCLTTMDSATPPAWQSVCFSDECDCVEHRNCTDGVQRACVLQCSICLNCVTQMEMMQNQTNAMVEVQVNMTRMLLGVQANMSRQAGHELHELQDLARNQTHETLLGLMHELRAGQCDDSKCLTTDGQDCVALCNVEGETPAECVNCKDCEECMKPVGTLQDAAVHWVESLGMQAEMAEEMARTLEEQMDDEALFEQVMANVVAGMGSEGGNEGGHEEKSAGVESGKTD